MQVVALGGGTETVYNIYDLTSIKQAVHWMHASLGYLATMTWLKA